MDEVPVELGADGRVWVDGREVVTDSADPGMDEMRAAALANVATNAAQQGRTVRVIAREPDGAVWPLLVHPSGRVEPDDARTSGELAGDPDATAVPARLRPRTDAIGAAVQGGREIEAMRLARRLEHEVAEQYGGAHPYALRCREMVAHTTLVGGMPAAACELYVSAARDWLAAHNRPAARAAAQRACGCWYRVDDAGRAVGLGEELVALLRDLGGKTRMAAVGPVVERIDELRLSHPPRLAG